MFTAIPDSHPSQVASFLTVSLDIHGILIARAPDRSHHSPLT